MLFIVVQLFGVISFEQCILVSAANLGWVAAPVIVGVLLIVAIVVIVLLVFRRRAKKQRTSKFLRLVLFVIEVNLILVWLTKRQVLSV